MLEMIINNFILERGRGREREGGREGGREGERRDRQKGDNITLPSPGITWSTTWHTLHQNLSELLTLGNVL